MQVMAERGPRLDTQVIHAGSTSRIGGAIVLPVFQSSAFERSGSIEEGYLGTYPRLSNLPNHSVLGRRLASIESAEAGLVTASGMSAIYTSLLTVLEPSTHLLVQDRLYGGTYGLLRKFLAPMNVTFDFIDAVRPESWSDALRPNTRAIYVEAISNPILQVADHRAVVEFARRHELVSMIDNTFASPVNFRPVEIGFDLSIHSGTKFLNGHSDLVAGAVMGSSRWVDRVLDRLNYFGASLDPHACFLLERGLKTLALRVRQQNRNAQALAEFLLERPEVRKVHYPGLPDHPDHARASELFDGFGGLLALELEGGAGPAVRFMDGLGLIASAISLGGVESLISRPIATSHAGLTAEERQRQGVSDALLRISVGVEAIEDIVSDVEQALESATGG